MTHAENKVEWCLKKAERETRETGIHRGLIRVTPNTQKAAGHLEKAEHYLKASEYLHNGNFSDICASMLFYCMYHCLLAIALKFGYESRNQECTFALIQSLIEAKAIDFELETLNKIASLDAQAKSSIQLREQFQYGVELSLSESLYQELTQRAKEILRKTKTILQT